MIKISIGKGKFHIIFTDIDNFVSAFSSSYLGQTKKRCWVLMSKQDNLIVVQPSVSTFGLNVLIFNTQSIAKDELDGLHNMFMKESVQIIVTDYLRRSSQAQGFTTGFKKVNAFVKALKLFYPNNKRCRAIIPKKGPLVVQPSVSTPELNTLVLEGFSSMSEKDKEKIKAINFSYTIICDTVDAPIKTTNF